MNYATNTYNQRIFQDTKNKYLDKIKNLVQKMSHLSQDNIKSFVLDIRNKIKQDRIDPSLYLEDIFAVIIIAIKNIFDISLHDVQIIGGILLYKNKIIEMQTGEGKTLVATLPSVLRALSNDGVHVITVNDYLVFRDATEMGRLYRYLGLNVGYILNESTKEERREAYLSDITYLTSAEAGFDYLRDNLALEKSEQVQRPLYCAIIDEVDSILLDEAVTPLVISEVGDDTSDKYTLYNNLIETLITPDDVIVDEKISMAYLKDSGYQKIEQCLIEMQVIFDKESLYTLNVQDIFYLNACLQAHFVYKKNIDYLVYDDRINIVSEKTGRMMEGRRWSEGLHQAIEAKEKLPVKGDTKTSASITLQNFLKLYPNISGMTGTAVTEANEFYEIYKIETVAIPPNKPVLRIDHPDLLYLTENHKFAAIIKQIKICLSNSQPVLVGTSSIESSERLSALLIKENVSHKVLNAKYLQKEASIIAQAGTPKAVTIATNMAGRGTDIILGGNISQELNVKNISEEQKAKIIALHQQRAEQVKKAGGLFVLIAERHKSRRIDNQLRGRCARQGEKGETQFYVSLDDPLIRLFIDKTAINTSALESSEDGRIDLPFLSRLLSNAQKIVEKNNFSIRKQLLEYDDIINQKRQIVYRQRNTLVDNSSNIDDVIASIHLNYLKEYQKTNNLSDVQAAEKIIQVLHLQDDISPDRIIQKRFNRDFITELSLSRLKSIRLRNYTLEKYLILQSLNTEWQNYINSIPTIKRNANLTAYAQQDPKNIFEKYSNEYFNIMTQEIRESALILLTNLWEDIMFIEEAKQSHQGNPMIGEFN